MPIAVPDQNIAAGVKTPDTMTSLGSMLNLANGAQQLQSGQIANASNQAKLDEATRIRQLFQDPSKLLDNEGNVDFNKAGPLVMTAAPTMGSEILSKLYTSQNQAIQAKRELNSLGVDQRGQVANFITSLGNDPAPVGLKKLDAFAQANPGLFNAVNFYKTHLLQPAASDQNAWQQATQQAGLSVKPVETQASVTNPTLASISNGGSTQVFNTNRFSQGGGSLTRPVNTIANTVTPENRQTLGHDASNNPVIVTKNDAGSIGAIKPAQVEGQQAPTKPFFLPSGETPETLKVVQGIRTNANIAASTVPQQQDNANKIIHYANGAITGTSGAEFLRGLGGGYAYLPWSTDAATNYDMLGHTIAQQTAQLAQSAGLNGTNSARDLAQELTANKAWTKDAVKQSTRTMRALSWGASAFNQGVENAVKSGDPFAARTFQNRWALTLGTGGIDALRLWDAGRNLKQDPEGLEQAVKSLGGVNSPQYKAAIKKVDEIRGLINGGQ